jgi:hypothetical protein
MTRFARLIAAALLLLPAQVSGEAAAGTVVAASAPLETSVTIYRAPQDRFGAAANDGDAPSRLDGYALISEVREVDLPAGPAVVRFPGVSAGMLAESVVISGLPGGVREKNLDAQLLSPRQLYAGWFGRPVTLHRTDASGKVREERAVIRSAPDGAAIIETDHGFEAVTCGPFEDALIYPGVPDGLFATPTLSIATDAPIAAHVRLRITYLAWDYDWRADYVLKLAPDLHHGVLSAWVTLASADVTSFPKTSAAVVAGKLNFEEHRADPDEPHDGDLTYHCFPRAPPPPPPMVAPPPIAMDIVVTAMRRSTVAQAENLGDLKLYRLPLPTTIAARGQKQVALFEPRVVALEVLHTAPLDLFGNDETETDAHLEVRTRNRQQDGLGLALPAGHMAIMVERGGGALLVGKGALADRAIGDRVEIRPAVTPQVHVVQKVTRQTMQRIGGEQSVTVTVSNANAFAVKFLGRFKQTPPASIRDPSAPLGMEDGHRVWMVRIPAHGRITLRYRLLTD